MFRRLILGRIKPFLSLYLRHHTFIRTVRCADFRESGVISLLMMIFFFNTCSYSKIRVFNKFVYSNFYFCKTNILPCTLLAPVGGVHVNKWPCSIRCTCSFGKPIRWCTGPVRLWSENNNCNRSFRVDRLSSGHDSRCVFWFKKSTRGNGERGNYSSANSTYIQRFE